VVVVVVAAIGLATNVTLGFIAVAIVPGGYAAIATEWIHSRARSADLLVVGYMLIAIGGAAQMQNEAIS
jgi:hypothetical protein